MPSPFLVTDDRRGRRAILEIRARRYKLPSPNSPSRSLPPLGALGTGRPGWPCAHWELFWKLSNFWTSTVKAGAKAAREAGKTAGKGQQSRAVVPFDRRKF